MLKDVIEGIGKTGIRVGVLKAASSKGSITRYGSVFFRPSARLQRETGMPIITPTQERSLGPQQAELLVGKGADPAVS